MLRLATPRDAKAVLAIYAPVVLTSAISFETAPPSEAEMEARIESTLRRYPWLVWDAGAGIGGFAYAGPHRTRPAYAWSVEVAAYVAKSARRQGVGRLLYGALLDILARQGFVTAFAGIALPNAASVALHESAGFRHAGIFHNAGYKLGAWRDVGWWERPLREPPPAPEAPIPFAEFELQAPADLQRALGRV